MKKLVMQINAEQDGDEYSTQNIYDDKQSGVYLPEYHQIGRSHSVLP